MFDLKQFVSNAEQAALTVASLGIIPAPVTGTAIAAINAILAILGQQLPAPDLLEQIRRTTHTAAADIHGQLAAAHTAAANAQTAPAAKK